MKSACAHTAPLRWVCMACALLAGCAAGPAPAGPGVIVSRDGNRTVWTTQEAEDAAKAAAAADADARRATARANQAARAPLANPAPIPLEPPSPATPPDLAPAELPAVRIVQFDFDRYEVKQEYWALIEGHARWLAADRSRRLVVEGHADERGGSEYNLALGQRRAEAVRQMMALLGVTPAQAEAVSFGDTRPLDQARTEEAFARNRRVELRPL
jgi:peptidoglycan-associated lipoprotein